MSSSLATDKEFARCRVERRAYDAGRGAVWEAEGCGRPRRKQRAREGTIAGWKQGTGRSARRTSGSCM
eukprot:scaffold26015_cov60-Phaeocystis_antarctica.AAC.2